MKIFSQYLHFLSTDRLCFDIVLLFCEYRVVSGTNNARCTNQLLRGRILHGVEHLAIFQSAIGMIERQHQVSHTDVLDGF